MTDIYKFLDDHQIEYERHDHPRFIQLRMSIALSPRFRQQKQKVFFYVMQKA